MAQSFSTLLAAAIEIAEETIEGANTAERVGGFLIQALKAMTIAYDSASGYDTGQYVVFNDAIYRSLSVIQVGESPSQAVDKWRLLSGRDGLDEVAKRGPEQSRGRTNQLLRLMGGLVLGNIPATTLALQPLVIDNTGKVWQRNSSGTPTDPPPTTLKSFTGGVHYEAVPTVVQGSRPLLANPTSDWLIEERGVIEKVLSNDEFTYNPTETYTKLANQYDGGTDTITALPGFIEFIPFPLPSRLRATITEGIANTAFPIRISMADKTGAADYDDFLFTLKVPVTASTCANYFALSEDQINALPIVMVQEFYDGTVSMGGGIPYTVRAYASRAEAVANIGIGGGKHNFDFVRASSRSCALGDTVYSDNRLEHILDGTYYRWPVEGGFWGIDLTAATATQAGSYVLIQTSPCGIVINRETITIPPTTSQPGLDFPLTLPFQFDN